MVIAGALASLYPGYDPTSGLAGIIVGTLYSLFAGAVAGLIFGVLYNFGASGSPVKHNRKLHRGGPEDAE